MESASKKRKICHDDDHQVDEEDTDHDEEEKMEKFYALIKNIREARDRLMINSSLKILKNNEAAPDDESRSKKQKLEEVERQVAVWKPSFRREDFMEDAQQLMKKRLPAISFASASQSKEGTSDDQKEVEQEGLDLTLSL